MEFVGCGTAAAFFQIHCSLPAAQVGSRRASTLCSIGEDRTELSLHDNPRPLAYLEPAVLVRSIIVCSFGASL